MSASPQIPLFGEGIGDGQLNCPLHSLLVTGPDPVHILYKIQRVVLCVHLA
jgi:hypothetical protein